MCRVLVLLCAVALGGCAAGARQVDADEPEKPAGDKGEKGAAGKPFELPDDASGKLLGKVLPPVKRPGLLENPSRPAPPPAPVPALAGLEPGLPDMPAAKPRRGPTAVRVVRPRTVTPEAADEGFPVPQVPARERFSTLPLTKDTSEPVIIPPGLPVLAERASERVPLDDPTAEASGASVLLGAAPERTKPVEYTRAGVPDPFKLRTPLPLPSPKEKNAPQVPPPVVPPPGK
jgi:hypothetical protein